VDDSAADPFSPAVNFWRGSAGLASAESS